MTSQTKFNALARLLEAELPDSIQELEEGAAVLIDVARKVTPVLSLVVSNARRDHFSGDPAGWISWADKHMQLSGAHLHHLRQCGDLMLDVLALDDKKSFWTLFKLESRKLLYIAQIEVTDIPAFLSHYDVGRHDRAWCESAVRTFLKLPPKADPVRAEQPDLPGFEKAVDTLAAFDDDFFVRAVKSAESSKKTLIAGLGMLGASLEYQKRQVVPDTEILQVAKAALSVGIAEIEQALARAAECANGTPSGEVLV